ncbi:DUF3667 domain-containing protein [Lacinutrix chionoecetis]
MVCKNCSNIISDRVNYCNNCGAKVIRNRLTMRNLSQDFAYKYFNYDNKFLKTIKTLITSPEVVIESYINGTRKMYVDAISFFAIALTAAGLQLFIIQNFFPNAFDVVTLAGQSGMEDFQKANMESLQKYQSLYMMAYIPMYALITKVVFFNKKRFNFTEILVIYLYLQAQITILLAVVTIALVALQVNMMYVGFISMPFMVIYIGYALKRLYKISVPGIILRTMGFFTVLFIVFVIAAVGFTAWMFLTESGQEFIEVQKAAKEAAKLKS